MRIKGRIIHLGLFALTLLLFSGGCALFERHPIDKGPKTALPSPPPTVHTLALTQSPGVDRLTPVEGGKPVAPQALASVCPPVCPPKVPIDAAAPSKIKDAAERDPSVLKELGERSLHLHTQHVRRGTTACPVSQPKTDTITQAAPDKKPDKAPEETIVRSAPPLITKLIYYNYMNNRTVVVCVQGGETSVGLMREGYQPPVGGHAEEEGSEVSQAVAFAKTDPRLKDYVEELKDLEAHAIVMEPARGLIVNEDGHGHRVLWVTFSKPESGEPEFWAIVDMSIPRTVLDAGKETQK